MDVDGLGDEMVEQDDRRRADPRRRRLLPAHGRRYRRLDTGRTYASSNSKKGIKGDPIPVGLETAEKIITELNKSKSQPSVACCLLWVSATWARAWARSSPSECLSIDKLILASEEDIAECEGIGTKIAASVKQFLAVPETFSCWSICAKRACRSRSISAPRTRKPQPTLAWQASSPTHSRLRV